MGNSQTDILRRQSDAAAYNAASGARARARQETSLVRQASWMLAKTKPCDEDAVRPVAERRFSRTFQPLDVHDPSERRSAPDGYVRNSPVQPICESADYRRRIIRRGMSAVILLLVALVLVWLLLQSGILAF